MEDQRGREGRTRGTMMLSRKAFESLCVRGAALHIRTGTISYPYTSASSAGDTQKKPNLNHSVKSDRKENVLKME